MDQIKENLFWIILGVVVIAALGLWVSYLPNVDEARSNAEKAADDVQKNASESTKGAIKSPSHVKAVEAYADLMKVIKQAM